MNKPAPITGPGIAWAIQQIGQHFGREIAKCAPAMPEEEAAEAEKEAQPANTVQGQMDR